MIWKSAQHTGTMCVLNAPKNLLQLFDTVRLPRYSVPTGYRPAHPVNALSIKHTHLSTLQTSLLGAASQAA